MFGKSSPSDGVVLNRTVMRAPARTRFLDITRKGTAAGPSIAATEATANILRQSQLRSLKPVRAAPRAMLLRCRCSPASRDRFGRASALRELLQRGAREQKIGIVAALVGYKSLGPGGLRQRMCDYAAMLGHTRVLEVLLEHTPRREWGRCLEGCAIIAASIAHLPTERRTAVLSFVAKRSGCVHPPRWPRLPRRLRPPRQLCLQRRLHPRGPGVAL
jgi:hypothetical protein